MPIETWYLSKSKEGKFGDMFFLKYLQEADASGGGANLLGTMVQWITSEGRDYPIPQFMDTPGAILAELEKRKSALGITKDLIFENPVAGSAEVIKVEKKGLFGLGVGPFPAIPLAGSLDIDYSKTRTIKMSFGPGTKTKYIPVGYLNKLYLAMNGKPSAAIGGALLTKNAYVNQVLLAKDYTVSSESVEGFSIGIEAKLKAYNSLPEIAGKVKVEKKTDRTLEAKINSPTFYLVALTAAQWSNLK